MRSDVHLLLPSDISSTVLTPSDLDWTMPPAFLGIYLADSRFSASMVKVSVLQIRYDFPVGARRGSVEGRKNISLRPESKWAPDTCAQCEEEPSQWVNSTLLMSAADFLEPTIASEKYEWPLRQHSSDCVNIFHSCQFLFMYPPVLIFDLREATFLSSLEQRYYSGEDPFEHTGYDEVFALTYTLTQHVLIHMRETL